MIIGVHHTALSVPDIGAAISFYCDVLGFEIVTDPVLSLFSFRHLPEDDPDVDGHNIALVNAINDDGRIYLTQTSHDGTTAIRFVAGQFEMQERDMEIAFEAITEVAREL